MDSNHNSPTLLEDKSDKKSLLPPINVSSVDGQAEHGVKDAASSKYATSGNGVSLGSGDSANNPISPKTPISPRQYNFERKDETAIQHYITKAHTSVRQGYPTTSSDKDKDLAEFAEMVSQMTHLLAAAGIGRETTTRALAYIAGPDKPEPKYALWEAKKDRRKKNNARRDASGGSAKTDDAAGVGQDKETAVTDKDAINTSESSNPPKIMDTYTTASDELKPKNEKLVPLIRKSNDASVAPIIYNGTNDGAGKGPGDGKKSTGRRRWWQRRNKGRSSQQTKGPENAGQQENTADGRYENQATKNDDTKSDGIKNEGTKEDMREDTTSEGQETPLSSATNAPAVAA